MRKKRTVLLYLIGAAILVIVLLAYNSNSGEPFYDGHPLSYWVTSLVSIPDCEVEVDQYQKATNAIDHIGVAALPFLVKWIQYKASPWRYTLAELLTRMPLRMGDHLSSWITDTRARQLAASTPYVFNVLGKRAMPAFDDLCRLMNDTNSPNTAGDAAVALGCLGTNALPPLFAVLTNGNHPARLGALYGVGGMSDLGDAAQFVVPAITNFLSATNDPGVPLFAIQVLGNLKAAPQISVPALISCLKSPNALVRNYSAGALGRFGPQGASAIPILTNALADSDPEVRAYAADALHYIDPATFPNAPSQ